MLELDGLRAIAVLLVIQFHWIVGSRFIDGIKSSSQALTNLMSLGWCGVDIFFVISGFLIGGILLDRQDSPNRATVFFKRRFLRIVPVYYLLLFLLLALPPALTASKLRTVPFWAFFAFLHNLFESFGWRATGAFGPLWSIAVEEQFYLLAPLLIWLLPRRAAFYCFGAMSVAAPLLRIGFAQHWLPGQVDFTFFTPARFDGLALGALGAAVVRNSRLCEAIAQSRRAHRVAIVTFVVAVVAISQWPIMKTEKLALPLFLTFLNVGFLTLILYVVLHSASSRLAAVLRIRPLVATGRVSYFLYLFHLPALYSALILVYLLTGLRSAVTGLPTAAILLALFSATSWKWFEGPLIALGHRLRYLPNSSSPPPSAVAPPS